MNHSGVHLTYAGFRALFIVHAGLLALHSGTPKWSQAIINVISKSFFFLLHEKSLHYSGKEQGRSTVRKRKREARGDR